MEQRNDVMEQMHDNREDKTLVHITSRSYEIRGAEKLRATPARTLRRGVEACTAPSTYFTSTTRMILERP